MSAQERPLERPEAPASTIGGKLVLALLVFLFFVRGLSTVLIYSIIPKLKSLFQLSYTEAMLTQLCFFLGYLIFSLPAAHIVRRLGYLRAIVLGLIVMIVGCLAILPLTWEARYPGFLVSLFVLAGGIILLQVADNPLIAMLGTSRGSSSRLTLAQAFNSLGTTVAPMLAAWLVFDSVEPPLKKNSSTSSSISLADLQAIHAPFLVVMCTLAVVAVIIWLNRSYPVPKTTANNQARLSFSRLTQNKHFLFGVSALFFYVGAEVSVAGIMASYLMQPTVLAVTPYRASQLLSLYWGAAMCGRFLGAGALRIVPPAIALSVCGALAAMLAILCSFSMGITAAAAIITIGLFNSIMFPTIFALALEGMGDATPEASGVLCMAIVGGAIIPEISGIIADIFTLSLALLVPAACYIWIAIYGACVTRPLQPAEA